MTYRLDTSLSGNDNYCLVCSTRSDGEPSLTARPYTPALQHKVDCDVHSHIHWALDTYRCFLCTRLGPYAHLPPLMRTSKSTLDQGTRKQKPRLFFETEKQRFLFVFVEAAEGKQEGLWEGSGHSGQGAVGGHAGTRHE